MPVLRRCSTAYSSASRNPLAATTARAHATWTSSGGGAGSALDRRPVVPQGRLVERAGHVRLAPGRGCHCRANRNQRRRKSPTSARRARAAPVLVVLVIGAGRVGVRGLRLRGEEEVDEGIDLLLDGLGVVDEVLPDVEALAWADGRGSRGGAGSAAPDPPELGRVGIGAEVPRRVPQRRARSSSSSARSWRVTAFCRPFSRALPRPPPAVSIRNRAASASESERARAPRGPARISSASRSATLSCASRSSASSALAVASSASSAAASGSERCTVTCATLSPDVRWSREVRPPTRCPGARVRAADRVHHLGVAAAVIRRVARTRGPFLRPLRAHPRPLPPPAPAPGVRRRAPGRVARGLAVAAGAVRERTAAYTSYDVSYRATSGRRSFTISGVLNVPTGRGPFPAVVLAHGYIDPAFYVRGQGMTRERGVFASRGYVALHVDYRGHAESTADPRSDRDLRLGYSADVIAAVKALRAALDVPVDDDRIALMGRSMGGGVVMKALIAEPGLVQAASLWASVSSLEGRTSTTSSAPTATPGLLRSWGRTACPRTGPPSGRPPPPGPTVLDHRAGADRARSLRRHLSAALGARHPGGHEASRSRLDPRVVRRRARLRTGVHRRHGPHDPLLRSSAVRWLSRRRRRGSNPP